jgi:hypothetical protein
MTLNSAQRSSCIAFLGLFALLARSAGGDELDYEFTGHAKGRFVAQSFPDDSALYRITGAQSLDVETDLRLNFSANYGRWEFGADYQLIALYGDRVQYSRDLSAIPGWPIDRLQTDNRRLFDLTHVIEDDGKFAALHRLDRLAIGYTGEKVVARFGRQAISWGNGMFFAPMDIVNPFDPTAVDKEYKTGDDMLYGQYLLDNGHDVQAGAVFRRDPRTGDVESDQATYALKYHRVSTDGELDFLLAQNYDDVSVGVGGNRSTGGAVWRADIVVTDTATETRTQFVTNLSYSWSWLGRNMTGVVEYYFNGFGQPGGQYDPQSLAGNPELIQRLARGEVFTLGRHYIAGGISIEMTPLWTVTPNLFANIEDPSALLQIVTQNSLGDNLAFLGSLNIPLGADGTEFGGIESGVPGHFNSTGAGVFAQIAWYF